MLVFVIKQKNIHLLLSMYIYLENVDKNMKEHETELCNIPRRAIHTTIEFDVYLICLLTCSVLSENEQTHHNQMWIKYQFKTILFLYSSTPADQHAAWNGSSLHLRTWVLSPIMTYNI